ncbi:MAG: ion channel [Candidatus Kapaibacterium sp.]
MATEQNGKPIKKQPVLAPELGYGTRASKGHQRLVNPDGSFNVRRKGDRKLTLADAYHTLIMLGWWKFFAIILVGFITVNFIFGSIYYLLGTEHLLGMIGDSASDKFWESFFFSAQTLTTVGYGRMSPVGFLPSAIAALESAIGLLSFALSTSLLWGRFSRPTAKIMYSESVLVAPYRGGKGVMFRAINGGRSRLVEIEAEVTMARTEMIDGKEQRRFYRLQLELNRISVLPTSWTLVHPVSEESPFFGRTKDDVEREETEVLIMLKAFDETYSQTVYSRTSYKSHQIVTGAKFIPMIEDGPDGSIILDMDKLNAHETVELPKDPVSNGSQLTA